MKLIDRRWFLAIGFVAAMGYMLGTSAYDHWRRTRPVQAHALAQRIAVSEQVSLQSVASLKSQGYGMVIDLRPDGEAEDQPSSQEIGQAVRDQGLEFYYVPVPHGDIPDIAVAQLSAALEQAKGPVLLYCRSGRRAARTWSLVEASRPGGRDAGAILAAVKAAGQSADDLEDAIRKRIAEREPVKEGRGDRRIQ